MDGKNTLEPSQSNLIHYAFGSTALAGNVLTSGY